MHNNFDIFLEEVTVKSSPVKIPTEDEMKNASTAELALHNSIKTTLITGRFQPFTVGHLATVKAAAADPECEQIVIVFNTRTAGPDSDSPFVAEQTMKLAQKTIENSGITKNVLLVNSVGTGYLPAIALSLFISDGLGVTKVVAGSDRAEGYKKMFAASKDLPISPEVVTLERDADSAAKGTNLFDMFNIKNNDGVMVVSRKINIPFVSGSKVRKIIGTPVDELISTLISETGVVDALGKLDGTSLVISKKNIKRILVSLALGISIKVKDEELDDLITSMEAAIIAVKKPEKKSKAKK